MRSDTQCPGCGARNAPEARACEWCGRAFLLRDQRRSRRRLWAATAALCMLAALVVAAAALINVSSLLPRSGAAASPPTATAVPTTTESVDVAATDEPSSDEPAPPSVEYVRVVNTGGQGVLLRREPSTTAPRVAARAENAVLEIVGADESAEGRVWRQVRDASGNRGWVPADFLAPAPRP